MKNQISATRLWSVGPILTDGDLFNSYLFSLQIFCTSKMFKCPFRTESFTMENLKDVQRRIVDNSGKRQLILSELLIHSQLANNCSYEKVISIIFFIKGQSESFMKLYKVLKLKICVKIYIMG